MRRNFAEILKTAKIDLLREYTRLYELFYMSREEYGQTLEKECKENFLHMPFRGTCLSLDDFNTSYGFDFDPIPSKFDVNYLVIFCEYTYNLIINLRQISGYSYKSLYIQQLIMVLDLIDYKFIYDDEARVNILIPRKPEAIAVAEIVDEKLAYSVLEYNHHSLKGNLAKKKAILILMADDLENKRKILNTINKTLSNNLFQMFQKFVRHNNDENLYIKNLSSNDLENCYDDIYQMWLLAKAEIDNLERKKRVESTLRKINA